MINTGRNAIVRVQAVTKFVQLAFIKVMDINSQESKKSTYQSKTGKDSEARHSIRDEYA